MASTLSSRLFGAHVRRLSDLILDQGRVALDALGVDLDAKHTSLVLALHESGPLASTELAEITGHMRQLVEARLGQLERAGVVVSARSTQDKRKRLFRLAPKSRRDVARLVAIMEDFEKVYAAVWREIGVDADEIALKVETALKLKPLLGRLCEVEPAYKTMLKERA